ncbi:MarR family transcriptional regulator [Enterococcus sp. HY326]|uniref:MarR family transcriptional regulator n=1 Tax=Enterococcus sp. HY326 TaxID=2971265 RepID=UPI00224095D7|nr:MarR family transcriptional regulator [Enterococcus sp. HY326]
MNQEELSVFNEKFQKFVSKYNELEQSQHFMQGEFNLSVAEVHTIVKIGSLEGINLINLAAIQNVSRSAITQMVNKLIKKEMVVKKRLEGSKNEYALFLSAKGKEINTIHQSQHEYLNKKILAILKEYPEDTLKNLQNMMQSIEEVWTELPWL